MELKVFSVYVLVCIVSATEQRDKRTIDIVLRSVADVFGYDIQKRPTALPPPSLIAPRSTFFPPPLAPLPIPIPKATAATPSQAPSQAPSTPMQPPKPAAPSRKTPVLIPKRPAGPTNGASPPTKVNLLIPAPPPPSPSNAAPPPPSAAAPPSSSAASPPAPPSAAAPQPSPSMGAPPSSPPAGPSKQPPIQTAPPLLTESIRKTFNINFNWDRNRQPVTASASPSAQPSQPPSASAPASPGPAPASPAAPAPAPPPSSAPAPAPPQSPAQPSQAPQPQPPPTPSAPILPPPIYRKPQLYEDYDSTGANKGYRNEDYQNSPDYVHNLPYRNAKDYDTAPEYSDYPNKEYQNQGTNTDYQNLQNDYENQPINNEAQNELQDSRDRFKDSIRTFWENSPWISNQNGLKFIIAPEESENAGTLDDYPSGPSKYEEYDVPQENPPKQDADYKNEQEANENDRDVENEAEYVTKEPTRNNHEHSDEGNYNESESSKKGYAKGKKYQSKKKNNNKEAENMTRQSSKNSEIVQPLYSGILPKQLHELYQKDKNAPWPSPFDTHYSASERKNNVYQYNGQNYDASKEYKPFLIRTYRQVNYVPEKYTSDYTYEVPEPTTEHYNAELAKINYDDDDDTYNKEFTENAKVTVTEEGKKITLLSVNNDRKAILENH